jgi:SAM-dependent methyltransferase
MKEYYQEAYFKTNNYTDYLQRQERYIRTASELHSVFSKTGIVTKTSRVLDYGCAVGFLLNGLKNLGYNNCFGYDISEWASSQAKDAGNTVLDSVNKLKFDMCFSLDVFEHMEDSCIIELLSNNSIDKMIVRIPCSEPPQSNKFFLEISRKDKTHINCKTKDSWIEFFKQLGYNKFFRLNMNTIYDSDGCFCCLIMK